MFHNSRIEEEKATVGKMIALYCKKQHHSIELCQQCQIVYEYATKRLNRCPYQNKKPACKNCTIHCYNPTMRDQIKIIMRFSGPKMIWSYPMYSLLHFYQKIIFTLK
jgi:hypothetical protein